MPSLHSGLHLQHYRHTGKWIEHAHTSYRVIGLLFVLTGLVLLMSNVMSKKVEADNLLVTAKIAATLPNQASQITQPVDGAALVNNPQTISGTCEVVMPAHIIRLESNSQFIGSSPCSPSGTFAISTDLLAGENRLFARTFNFTEDEGPVSDEVVASLSFDATVSPPNAVTKVASSSQSGNSQAAIPLRIRSDMIYVSFYPHRKFELQFSVEGGSPPYAILVDWGDSRQELISVDDSSALTVEHVYRTTNNRVVTLRAVDQAESNAVLQMAATSAKGLALNLGNTGVFSKELFTGATMVIWSIYAIISVAALSFYLGEQRELKLLRPSHK